MAINMRVNLRPTTLKGSGDIPGTIAESMKDFGRTIKCTVKEPLSGLMEGNTKVIT
jgi:hypothetical protein